MKKALFVLCSGCFFSVNASGVSGFPMGSGTKNNSTARFSISSSSVSSAASSRVSTPTRGLMGDGEVITEGGSPENTAVQNKVLDAYSSQDMRDILVKMDSLPASEIDGSVLDKETKEGLRVLLGQRVVRRITSQERLINSHRTRSSRDYQKIGEQQKTIEEQGKKLSKAQLDISGLRNQLDSVKRTSDKDISQKNKQISGLTQQVKELEKQVVLRDQDLEVAKSKIKSNERIAGQLIEAAKQACVYWTEEERKAVDVADSPMAKLQMVITNVLNRSVRQEEAQQQWQSKVAELEETVQQLHAQIAGQQGTSKSLELNPTVDVSRYDFLMEKKDDFFEIGDYRYRGDIDEGGLPVGEGEISDKFENARIKGVFDKGYLDISKPIFVYEGEVNKFKFQFPGKIPEDKKRMIGCSDLCRSVFFFRDRLMGFRPSSGKVSFLFSEDFVYVGGAKIDKACGQGIRFHKGGSIQIGKFDRGYFVGGEEIKPTDPDTQESPTKRKRTRT